MVKFALTDPVVLPVDEAVTEVCVFILPVMPQFPEQAGVAVTVTVTFPPREDPELGEDPVPDGGVVVLEVD